MADFFRWFDTVSETAFKSKVGQLLVAHGFSTQHTGGGCLAWERASADEKLSCLITTDDGTDLGDDIEDIESALWLVGFYDADGESLDDPYGMAKEVVGLTAAIAYAESRLNQ